MKCLCIVFIVFQLLRNQFKEYFEVNFYNPDFKYHQRELDEQILCNKRIRQNVREAREMYADKSNPWYSRKTFKPKEVSVVFLFCFFMSKTAFLVMSGRIQYSINQLAC